MTKEAFFVWIFTVSMAARWCHWHGSRPDTAAWHRIASFALQLPPLPPGGACSLEWEPHTEQPVLLTEENAPLVVPRVASTQHRLGNEFRLVHLLGFLPDGRATEVWLRDEAAACALRLLNSLPYLPSWHLAPDKNQNSPLQKYLFFDTA